MVNNINCITYKQALIFKSLGFNELCDKFYDAASSLHEHKNMNVNWRNDEECCSAPTPIQAYRWLLKVYHCDFIKKQDLPKDGYDHPIENRLLMMIDIALTNLEEGLNKQCI